jgi:hypothetical protein
MPRKKIEPGERPADLLFWLKDGTSAPYEARVPADVEVSIGRTDSELALGFWITTTAERKHTADFVLDRDQVAELAAFMQLQLARLRKPLGRKPDQISFVAMTSAVARRTRRK